MEKKTPGNNDENYFNKHLILKMDTICTDCLHSRYTLFEKKPGVHDEPFFELIPVLIINILCVNT